MKLYLDTANIDEIREATQWGVISGVTTNPSLAAKEDEDFNTILSSICDLVDGPISAEVLSLEYEGMVKEGRALAAVHKNVVVKIPIIPEGMRAVKTLSSEGIRVNVTLIFSANQALLAARAGAAFVSPFIGRLDDIGHTGVNLVRDIVDIIDLHDLDCEVIAASIRHTEHVPAVALAGAHIATMPFKVLKQMFKHPLTDLGIENFLNDWKKAEKSLS
ncbi:MAG: fructose-6-phosphate aldolase [Dethiobacteria bacterium]|nr:fructose-6-phosphate aldolase [Bacillota bacterium]MDW7730357.1 fructose-6-phosphate aldolase [Bacillota bacterium]